MGDIQEELEQILNARYGKDVRQNIHDAIETCYTDGRVGVIDYVARAELEKTATTDQLGRVKVDGETITADADGTLHGAAQVPEGVLVGEGTEITPDRPLLVAHKAAVDSNNNNIAQHFATIENDIGDTDEISSIGDGTICGALSAVDNKLTVQSGTTSIPKMTYLRYGNVVTVSLAGVTSVSSATTITGLPKPYGNSYIQHNVVGSSGYIGNVVYGGSGWTYTATSNLYNSFTYICAD